MTSPNNRLAVLAADIREAHAQIEHGALAMAERAIAAGSALVEAKAAVAHGKWTAWLTENTGLSDRTARRYMQVAQSGLKTATVAVLGARGAAEAIAAWPLPRPNQILRINSTSHWPGELGAIIWPARQGGFNTYLLDGEYVNQSGPAAGSGGSATTNKKPWPRELISHLMISHGFDRAHIRAERIACSDFARVDEMRRDLLMKISAQ